MFFNPGQKTKKNTLHLNLKKLFPPKLERKSPDLCSPSVCTLFYRHLSTYDLQILDSKRRLSIYEDLVFRSKTQELWD
jgi:hypothetical protein